jgi:hypothetical protein
MQVIGAAVPMRAIGIMRGRFTLFRARQGCGYDEQTRNVFCFQYEISSGSRSYSRFIGDEPRPGPTLVFCGLRFPERKVKGFVGGPKSFCEIADARTTGICGSHVARVRANPRSAEKPVACKNKYRSPIPRPAQNGVSRARGCPLHLEGLPAQAGRGANTSEATKCRKTSGFQR